MYRIHHLQFGTFLGVSQREREREGERGKEREGEGGGEFCSLIF